MERAKQGQRLGEVITAANFNRIASATESVEAMQQGGKMPQGNNTAALVKVKNASGGNLKRFAAVAMAAPVFTPESSEAEGTKKSQFWAGPLVTVESITADDTRKIAIMAEPVADGKVGAAVVSGITPAVVSKPASGSEFTGAKAVAAGLELTTSGGLPVIWWDSSGTGKLAAIVEVTTGGGNCAAESDDDDCFKCFPDDLTTIEGYNASNEQALTHATTGCLVWVDIEDCT
jgi:hypothetical protein